MTDLVERLRTDAERVANPHLYETQRLEQEAADEIERLRAEVADLREECATYRGLQADQANARCELLEMLKLERARVAELEAVLTQIAGMTSIAHGNHAAYVAADALRAGPMKPPAL